MPILKSQKGQGLIEYLLIVALMSVAAIAVLRVVSTNIRAQFANVSNAIQGKENKARTQDVEKSMFETKDMSDFMNGAARANKE
jgi:Flp pilus assembly pilin Flp